MTNLWHASYTPTAMPMLTHAAMTRLKARDCTQGQQRCLVPYLLWTTKLFLTYVWVCMYVEDISITFTRSWKELTPGNRSSSDTNTFSSSMSQFWTILIETLFSILLIFRPGLPPSTMNLIYIMVRHKKKITLTYKVNVNNANAWIYSLPYPLTWLVLVFRARTTNTSAKLLFPGHRFLPFSTHPPGTY